MTNCEPDCGGFADYAAVPCPNPDCDRTPDDAVNEHVDLDGYHVGTGSPDEFRIEIYYPDWEFVGRTTTAPAFIRLAEMIKGLADDLYALTEEEDEPPCPTSKP